MGFDPNKSNHIYCVGARATNSDTVSVLCVCLLSKFITKKGRYGHMITTFFKQSLSPPLTCFSLEE